MVARVIAVEPFDIIVFGASGDLAGRKLWPALYHRDLAGQLPETARVIGVSRRANTQEEFRAAARAAVQANLDHEAIDMECLERFCRRLFYIPVDVAAEQGWPELAEILRAGRQEAQPP